MVKSKFIQVGISRNINPEFSVTYIKRSRKYNLFREIDGMDLGNHTRNNMLKFGFTSKQLVIINKKGTVNFQRKKR